MRFRLLRKIKEFVETPRPKRETGDIKDLSESLQIKFFARLHEIESAVKEGKNSPNIVEIIKNNQF